MTRADELRAELDLLARQEEFAAAKESGGVTMDDKLALRAARQEFRERRAGSATAQPEAISATARVKQTGS